MFVPEIEPLSAFHGRKVTVMGLGLFGGGSGVTEFLCRRGADVTVTDLRSEKVLEPAVHSLRHFPIRWALGGHREEQFLGADLVVPSAAVPRDADLLQLCRRRGIPLDTEMNLFFKYCQGKIGAVTGSNGKTTTTSLTGAMARERWPNVRVGGNLGKSLLPEVESIQSGEWVVLELSSFQLEDLACLERRPEVSVITNLSPNHLDRHGTYDSYLAAKHRILERGGAPNVAVLNGEDALTRSWGGGDRQTYFFGRTAEALPPAPGVWIDCERQRAVLADGRTVTPLFALQDVPLPGRFNLFNAAAAAAAATAMGVGGAEIHEAICRFRPIEHRLEPVAEQDGIRYLNDSVATTPESTIVALDALGPNLVLICGGSDKGCSFRALGQAIARRTRAVVLLGQTADAIGASIPRRTGGPALRRTHSLEEAVAEARELARPGDVVLLSPACPSYDLFTNFVERGRRFKEIVKTQLTPTT